MEPPRPLFHLGYRPALDGLRAVAILPVLAFHFRSSDTAFPTRGGFLGVDLFFVLSGFLITSLLCEEFAKTGRVRMKLFYARRALRLLPALFVMLAAFVVWAATIAPHRWLHAELRETIAALLYAENWFRAFAWDHPVTAVTSTWSLSLEEQFYIVWPLALVVLLRYATIRIATAAVAVAFVASGLVRALEYHGGPEKFLFFFTRPDSLLIGCLLALLLAQGVRLRPPRWLGWSSLAVMAALFVTAVSSAALFKVELSLFALAAAMCLWTTISWPEWTFTRALEHRPMVEIGRISYGLYLWHMPVFYAVRLYVPHARFAAPIALVLTFAVALASYYGLERRFLKLKTRISPVKGEVPERPALAPRPQTA